ncbi:unnamed protein product [Blepharisma stoltei]|uniref:Uncharacterized protein n=1 Tax=Blepharisma stoltei TaxID=1481888 RepID=A0AAU9IWS4_9CILI|nr:unnamed protein product [Blepharisma stoltei]
MEQTINPRRKPMTRLNLLDTQQLPHLSFCESPKHIPKLRIPSSNVNKSDYLSPRLRKRAETQSLADFSFSFDHQDLKTPRCIKASHGIEVLPSPRVNFTSRAHRSSVTFINKRAIATNLLLDTFPHM